MTLRLKVDRNTLEGHERALVDGLFFDKRTRDEHEGGTAASQEQGFRSRLRDRRAGSDEARAIELCRVAR